MKYNVARILLLKEVMVHSVVDKFLFKVRLNSWSFSPMSMLISCPFQLFLIRGCFTPINVQVPGIKLVLEVFCCTPGTVDSLAEQLREGKILGLSPGGVYEAQFGDHNYRYFGCHKKLVLLMLMVCHKLGLFFLDPNLFCRYFL